jgi:Divergent InlB B-repeat domain
MVGGVFEGTNGDPVNGPYTTIYTITVNPPQAWSQVSVSLGNYRYLRYRGPNGSYGNVSELEFYRNGVKVTGAHFGTAGSWNNGGATFDKALDGNVNTYFDAPTGDGTYVGIDTAAAPVGPFTLTVEDGSGSGQYPAGTMVTVTANTPAVSDLQFAQWIGLIRVDDTNILADPFMPSTTATMPSRDVKIAATYGGTSYLADTIRYYPRAGFTERMVGGVFEGTNGDPVNGPYTTIYTIRDNPPLKWSYVGGVSLANYRYLRYRAPDGSFGNIADIAFARNGVKLTGAGYGTPGSWNNGGDTFAKALDGDISTSFDGPTPNGCYVGIDMGTRLPEVYTLTVSKGSGTGNYPEGELVKVTADTPPAAQEFAGWTGDIAILSNPFIPTTTVRITRMAVAITATYKPVTASDTIRFYPRAGFADRMVGGVFEGTNEDPLTGPYTTVYTVTSTPPLEWAEASASLGNYRYLRYRGAAGSFGNVGEIEFYRNGVKLTGPGYGTTGSWENSGNTFSKALDGDVNSFFDAPTDTAYVGIDTIGNSTGPDTIRYYPRYGFSDRMVGGVFEGTNGDPVTGTYTPIYTISTNPPLAWSEIGVNLGNYRYLRYRGATGSFGNVGEIEFYRNGVKLTGPGYGTAGSWSNVGNTFSKAFDADVNTFFDAPTDTAYVGIDTGGGAVP